MWQQLLTEHRFLHKDIQGVGPIGAVLKAGAEVILCCPIWQHMSLGGVSQDCPVVLHTHQCKQQVAFESFLSKKNKELREQLALQQHPRIRVPLAAAQVSDQHWLTCGSLFHHSNEEEEQSLATLRPHHSLSLGGKFPVSPCCDAPEIIRSCGKGDREVQASPQERHI